jgi:hypothetical protein
VHWSNNELGEIDKDADGKEEEDLNAELDDNSSILNDEIEDDESKEDAYSGANNDNSLFGNSDKYDCSQITGYENDQWIAEHMLEDVPSSNARFHLWEFLICSNQHSVLPWSMITNSTSRGGKKAPPWQPRLLQAFKTGSMNAKDSNTWKAKYQAVITYKIYH